MHRKDESVGEVGIVSRLQKRDNFHYRLVLKLEMRASIQEKFYSANARGKCPKYLYVPK